LLPLYLFPHWPSFGLLQVCRGVCCVLCQPRRVFYLVCVSHNCALEPAPHDTAIHGFCPTNATKSLFIYVRYFSSPTTYAQDKSGSFVKATFATMIHHLLRFILWLFVLGCYHSWLSTYPNWLVFGSPADTEEWYSFGRVVSLKQWGSNLFVACTYLLLLIESSSCSRTRTLT
jgi:hypothetical protein